MGAAAESTPPPKKRARTRKAAAQPAKKAGGKKGQPKAQPHAGGRWMWLIPALAFAVLTTLAVLSFDAGDALSWRTGAPTHNWIGPVGHGLAWALFHAFGISAYGAAAILLTAAVLACSENGLRFAPLATFGWALVGTATSALAHLLADAKTWSYPPGGALGRAVGDAARGAFSTTGSLILLLALFCMALLLATHFAAARAFELAARGVGKVSAHAARTAYAAYDRHRRAKLMREELDEEEEEEDLIEAGEDGRYPLVGEIELEDDEEEEEETPPPPPKAEAKKPAAKVDLKKEPAPKAEAKKLPEPAPRIVLPDVPPDQFADEPPVKAEVVEPKKPARAKKEKAPEAPKPPPMPIEDVDLDDIVDEPVAVPAPVAAPMPAPSPAPVMSAPEPAPAPRVPAIIEPRAPPKPAKLEPKSDFQMAAGSTGFHCPSLDDVLENTAATQVRKIDRNALTFTATKLVQKLNDLGVEGEVTEIRPGPVVTMYEFKPAAGIKLSRIASLGDDLAMAMEALRVRIVAPIPGKGVVGFEVPNKTRDTVFLKEVVEQEAFQKGASKLTMAIGKDIEGMPYVSDLAKMPHLLIAGTTGSGKSVGVNSMLVSMLMRATPEELRFIMVDPKMLELSIYEGIPHLLLPVVTDPKKAALALRWGVEEMERRYQLMAEAGVRNIGQYNKHLEKELAAKAAEPKVEVPTVDEDGDAVVVVPSEEPKAEPKKLPYIVIVIDELADLMMVAAKEVEVYIARLAQMARAAGIHLMVATQRPSTDVLTGVIKANFPSRISFQVASRHDSGTIINTPGAENLLGMGDMLILPPGTSSLTRVHGAYVSESEINRLTAFWKAQGAPVYDPEILKPRAEDGDEGGGEDEVADELYDQAIHAVSTMQMVSISLLQRKMRIGYNRAARMIERMEREGIVGPADGAKPREVLIRGIGDEPNV